VPSLDDAARIAVRLPEVTEGERYGSRTWLVAGKAFAWERPLSKADIKRLQGAPVPAGPLLAVSTVDLDDKDAILASGFSGVFTIPHFDGYPAILIELGAANREELEELIFDAWLAKAPPATAEQQRLDRGDSDAV
jgi:hypothetical protein